MVATRFKSIVSGISLTWRLSWSVCDFHWVLCICDFHACPAWSLATPRMKGATTTCAANSKRVTTPVRLGDRSVVGPQMTTRSGGSCWGKQHLSDLKPSKSSTIRIYIHVFSVYQIPPDCCILQLCHFSCHAMWSLDMLYTFMSSKGPKRSPHLCPFKTASWPFWGDAQWAQSGHHRAWGVLPRVAGQKASRSWGSVFLSHRCATLSWQLELEGTAVDGIEMYRV